MIGSGNKKSESLFQDFMRKMTSDSENKMNAHQYKQQHHSSAQRNSKTFFVPQNDEINSNNHNHDQKSNINDMQLAHSNSAAELRGRQMQENNEPMTKLEGTFQEILDDNLFQDNNISFRQRLSPQTNEQISHNNLLPNSNFNNKSFNVNEHLNNNQILQQLPQKRGFIQLAMEQNEINQQQQLQTKLNNFNILRVQSGESSSRSHNGNEQINTGHFDNISNSNNSPITLPLGIVTTPQMNDNMITNSNSISTPQLCQTSQNINQNNNNNLKNSFVDNITQSQSNENLGNLNSSNNNNNNKSNNQNLNIFQSNNNSTTFSQQKININNNNNNYNNNNSNNNNNNNNSNNNSNSNINSPFPIQQNQSNNNNNINTSNLQFYQQVLHESKDQFQKQQSQSQYQQQQQQIQTNNSNNSSFIQSQSDKLKKSEEIEQYINSKLQQKIPNNINSIVSPPILQLNSISSNNIKGYGINNNNNNNNSRGNINMNNNENKNGLEVEDILKRVNQNNLSQNSGSRAFANAMRALQQRIRELERMFQDKESEFEQISQKQNIFEMQMNQQIQQKDDQLIEYKQQLIVKQKQLDTMQNDMDELQLLFSKGESERNTIFQRMEDELIVHREERIKNNERMQVERTEKNKLIEELSKLKKQLEDSKNAIRIYQTELEQMNEDKIQQEKRLSKERSQREEQVSLNERLSRDSNKQKEHYNEQLRLFQNEIGQLESSQIMKISELEKKVNQLQEEEQDYKYQINQYKQEITSLNQQQIQLSAQWKEQKQSFINKQRKLTSQIHDLRQQQAEGNNQAKSDMKGNASRNRSPLGSANNNSRQSSEKKQVERRKSVSYNYKESQELDQKRMSKSQIKNHNESKRSAFPTPEKSQDLNIGNNSTHYELSKVQQLSEQQIGKQTLSESNRQLFVHQQPQEQINQSQFDTPLFSNQILSNYNNSKQQILIDNQSRLNASQLQIQSHLQQSQQQQQLQDSQYYNNNNNNSQYYNNSQLQQSSLNNSNNLSFLQNVSIQQNQQIVSNNDATSEKYQFVIKQIIEAEKQALALSSDFQIILTESAKTEDSKKKHELRGRLIELNEQINKNNQKLFALKRKEQEQLDAINGSV